MLQLKTLRVTPRKHYSPGSRIRGSIQQSGKAISPGRSFMAGLNRRLRGHYNYYGLIGNSWALWRFCQWAIECAFKWLNRRGGKRSSFTWAAFNRALELLHVTKPRIRPRRTQHAVLA